MRQFKLVLSSIVLFCLLTSCYNESDFKSTSFTFDDLVSDIDIEKTQIIANGVDKSKVKIYFDPNQNIDNLTFSGTLSNGTFESTGNDSITLTPKVEQSVTPQKIIEFNIVSTLKQEEILLKLNINDFTKEIVFSGIRSFPDKIELNSTPVVFHRARKENIDISILLSSLEGDVSHNTELTISALDSLNRPIGNFITHCDDFGDSNECISTYNIWPDTLYVGKIKIETIVPAQNGTLTESINLYTTN